MREFVTKFGFTFKVNNLALINFFIMIVNDQTIITICFCFSL